MNLGFLSPIRSLASKIACFVLLPCLFVVQLSTAQNQSSASLNGVVEDATGAVISGVKVTLTNVETGVAQSRATNGAGLYAFSNILPGSYTLVAVHEGFGTEERPNLVLEVNQTATINFKMQVGSTSTKVLVSGQAVELETSTAEVGDVIGTKEVLDLPLNGRNFTELLLLSPGVSALNPLQNAGGPAGAIGAFVYPAINGQSNRSNMFLLDGINNYGPSNDTSGVQPTIDDVLEFKVQSHNDEAQFGQIVGGIVNLVTKSGGNAFHGDAWEFFRNDGLDASNFFSPQKTPLHQNQFGVSAGGPVVLPGYNGRNRTFFYGSYEGFRQTTASSSLYLVPTSAQLNGDFTAAGGQIYNPFSAVVAADGSYTNGPFLCDSSGNPSPVNSNNVQTTGTPCNMVPSSLIDPLTLNFAQTVFPKPENTGNSSFNGQDNSPVTVDANQMSARIDQKIGSKDQVFFRFTGSWQTDVASAGYTGMVNSTKIDNYNLAAVWTHTFGSSALVQFSFGRGYGTNDQVPSIPSSVPADFAINDGFAPNFVNHSVAGKEVPILPTVCVDGYLCGGPFESDGVGTNIWEYRADGSKMIGRHFLKFGGSLATDNVNNFFYGSVDVFDPLQTSNGSAGEGGDGVASMLLGFPTYAELDNGGTNLVGGKIYGFYGEDQWKVTNKLTLNLGLRYDLTIWPHQAPNEEGGSSMIGDMDLSNGTYILQQNAPACSASQGAPCIPGGTLPAHVVVSPNGRIIHNTFDNIQPRFGFAYQLNGKTVVRGAWGRFYDNWAAVIGFGANFGDSWPTVTYLSDSNLNVPYPTASANDPLGIGSGQIVPAANPFGYSDGFLDPHLPNPYSNQYNFGFQRGWAGNSVLTVNYVGSTNHREMLQLTGNAALTPGPGDPQLRAPYPYITAQQGYVQGIGASNYNGLQVSSQGRTAGGFTHTLAYTYSKGIDFGCDTYGSFCDVQDPYHWQKDKGVAGWDSKHIFSGSFVYALPFGKGRRWSTGNRVTDYVIGGWQTNAIATMSGGSPYDVQAPYQISNTNNITGAERANVVGNPYAGATKLNPINVNAFALPAAFTFGNMGRNTLRSDWHRNVDFSLFRTFTITESKKLEFRIETFNLTNTPVFAVPDNNITDPNFGVVSSIANVEREVQLAAKFYF